MADKGTARETEAKFEVHPEGPRAARCVDFINYGLCVMDFPGKPKELAPKVAFVYRTGQKNSKGEFIDVVAEFTNFFSPKAKLRLHLEQWRGKAYTQEQAKASIDLSALVGKYALINIGHKTSGTGRTYAVILSISQIPTGMPIPADLGSYERPEYLVKRKAAYKAASDAYRAEIGVDEDGNPLSKQGRVKPEESGGTGIPDDAWDNTLGHGQPLGEDDGPDSLPF